MLRSLLVLSIFLVAGETSLAQSDLSYESRRMAPIGSVTVDLGTAEEPFEDAANFVVASEPGGMKDEIKARLHAKRLTRKPRNYLQNPGSTPANVVGRGFMANTASGTPNDNSIAISNGGFVVSVVNTNIRIYDSTGKQLVSKSLSTFAKQLGTLNRTFDPRAIYDPEADRFIVVFLNGTLDSNNNVIACFSKTNDPTKEWNCYKVPGNPRNDSTWSDYPIVAISKHELFMTFNSLENDKDWRDGFERSLIWQISKADGYAGDSLRSNLFSEIKFKDQYVWSICPVHGGSELPDGKMHFLSVRPSAEQNDTVFLHTITGTLTANPTLSQSVHVASKKYGLPPNAFQPNEQYLSTNDARVLDAMIEGDNIYFVGNTVNLPTISPSVFIGSIDLANPTTAIPANILSFDTLDIGYPSISSIGVPPTPVITFSHSSSTTPAGTSAAMIDPNTLQMTRYLRVKEGQTSINVLPDSIERWGDYTAIQRRYNDPEAAWLSGSFGFKQTINTSPNHRTWVGEVRTSANAVGDLPVLENGRGITFPSPVRKTFQLAEDGRIRHWTLLDISGRSVASQVVVEKNGSQVSFDVSRLPQGVYQFSATLDDGRQVSDKISVQH